MIVSDDMWVEVISDYLKNNSNININDIAIRKKYLYNGTEYAIGNKLRNLRKLIKAGKKIDNRYIELGLKVDSNNNKIGDSEWINIINNYLVDNPTKGINDILLRDKYVFNGVEYAIGAKINYLRSLINNNKKIDNRYIELGLQKKSNNNNNISDDDWIEVFKSWIKDNPTRDIDDIKGREKYFFNGIYYLIGSKVYNLRRSIKNNVSIDKRYIELGIVNNYIDDFDGDIEKVKKVKYCLRELRDKKRKKEKNEFNINTILKEFDVNIDILNKYLNKTRVYETKKNNTLMYKDDSLRNYCIRNGYNYDVVMRIIKLHKVLPNYSLDKVIDIAINDYNTKGQSVPYSWVYESYGKLLKHKLLYLGLDSNTIIKNMKKYTISLEEAMREEIYRVNCREKKFKWLEELYNYLIDELSFNKDVNDIKNDLVEMFMLLVTEYKLNLEEYRFLWKMFSKYVDTIKKYQIVDVGLDDNKGNKLNKIVQYNFDEEMICDACFVPYEFDGRVLRGRDSYIYKRMMLLKEITFKWNAANDNDRKELIKKYNINEEELKIIISKRNEINMYGTRYNQIISRGKH